MALDEVGTAVAARYRSDAERTQEQCLMECDMSPAQLQADGIMAVCEEFGALVERRALDLRTLCKELRRELGPRPVAPTGGGGAAAEDAWGVVTDIMSVVGLASSQDVVAGGGDDPDSAAAASAAEAGDLGPALDFLERSPERAWRAGARLASDLTTLHDRLGVLRAEWAEVRAHLPEAPPEAAWRIEALAEREARGCRARAAALLGRAEDLFLELEDALEQRRLHRGERLRWQAKSQSLLGDLAPASSKAFAMSRLRRGVPAPVVVSVPPAAREMSTLALRPGRRAQKPLGLKEALRAAQGGKAESMAPPRMRAGNSFGLMDLASMVSWNGPVAGADTNPMGLLFAATAGAFRAGGPGERS